MAEDDVNQAGQGEPAAGDDLAEPAEGSQDAESVEQALSEAEASLGQMRQAVESAGQVVDNPDQVVGGPKDSGIELLGDVELQVMIELGRSEMLVEDVLRLKEGSVVELDKLAGDPVDVFVNGRLVARGEVLVLNDNFCIRVGEIVANIEEQVEAAASGLTSSE